MKAVGSVIAAGAPVDDGTQDGQQDAHHEGVSMHIHDHATAEQGDTTPEGRHAAKQAELAAALAEELDLDSNTVAAAIERVHERHRAEHRAALQERLDAAVRRANSPASRQTPSWRHRKPACLPASGREATTAAPRSASGA